MVLALTIKRGSRQSVTSLLPHRRLLRRLWLLAKTERSRDCFVPINRDSQRQMGVEIAKPFPNRKRGSSFLATTHNASLRTVFPLCHSEPVPKLKRGRSFRTTIHHPSLRAPPDESGSGRGNLIAKITNPKIQMTIEIQMPQCQNYLFPPTSPLS